MELKEERKENETLLIENGSALGCMKEIKNKRQSLENYKKTIRKLV